MATIQNTYTANGSTTLYSFTFPYLKEDHVKVSLNGVITTAYTFANATSIQFNTAPSNGTAIVIYRETDDNNVESVFYAGSAIRAEDLNDNATQSLYLVQEAKALAISADASAVATQAQTALNTANTAISTANAASTTANGIASTANTALTNSTNAVSTANTANTTANTANTTANTANTTANSALSTANSAVSTANTALSTAQALNPTGMVIWVAMSNAPTGFIKANGAAVSRTTYAALFAAIGTTFGSGDGSTTFNVPDLRGEFVRGWDDGRGVDSGRSFGSFQSWAIQNITGSIARIAESFVQSSFSDTSALYRSSTGPNSGLTPNQVDTSASGTLAFDASRNVQTSNETRPRNVALLACIKY